MLKMKRMTMLVVVALGLVALAAPAAAPAKSNKSIQRLNKDVDRLGKNVNELRKKTDEMNNTIASLASVAGDALTKLEKGLTQLADTTANFKYGVVQVATVGDAIGETSGIAGVGPTHFFATPPMYATGEQSTVTFSIPDLGLLNDGPGPGIGSADSRLKLYTAVRSVNPDQGKVSCRVTLQANGNFEVDLPALPGAFTNVSGGVNSAFITMKRNTTDGAFVTIPQSRIAPENGDKNFPVGLVATEDKAVDLADDGLMANALGFNILKGGLAPIDDEQVWMRGSTVGGATATLSCITS